MKKILLFAVFCACTLSAFAEDFEKGGIYYNLLGGDSVAVTFQGDNPWNTSAKYADSVAIPATVEYDDTTYRVTNIGEYAFYYCSNLTAITIPNSVTTIGRYAFDDCSSLTAITIPNSVTKIDYYAFSYCSNLAAVTIPNSVIMIGEHAFGSCRRLTSITIPNSVTTIDDAAFSYCSGIETITVETGNPSYHSVGNCLIETATKTLHTGCKNSIIPTDGSVITIGDYAFNGCSSLTAITIPTSVTTIGDWAFTSCSSLTAVTIPNSVITIGYAAFSICSGIETIIVEPGNSSYHSAGNCLIETATKTLYTGCKNSIIPTDGSVTTIGDEAFCWCSDLTAITIPNGVTTIGDWAFTDCKSLTAVTIPNSVTTIGDNAFSCCFSLTDVTISNSVTTIGDWAFSGCSNLQKMTCLATEPPAIEANTFYMVNREIPVFVPDESIAAYQDDIYWREFLYIQGILGKTTGVALSHSVSNKTRKVFENGTLYIVKPNGERYTIDGRKVM